MKHLLFIFALFIPVLLLAQTENPLPANWINVVLVVAGIYEILARLIPTTGKWSIVHLILTFVKWLSEKLDNTKVKKK